MTEPATLADDIRAAREAARQAWERAHQENAGRETVVYLGVAYDQADRAMRAVQKAPGGCAS